ncbi:ribosomal protein S18-alanine N-acetyltransferase [Ideonella azotifigens]|uniref:[Ribosomal protein bS18]-alanine N-acetyltransferase n=1 Tax=Ideonella azotifigens TaxID=513160 RepID=A0ABP3VJ54_9BURK
MSARPQATEPCGVAPWPALGGLALRAMTLADLDLVCHLEQQAYSFPWSRGNFTDSLAAGYAAWLLIEPPASGTRRAERQPGCLGYYVAMPGVEEAHLLNITVAPAAQGRGHARRLLAHLAAQAWGQGAQTLWLEVRDSNQRARRLYAFSGFTEVGRRKAYYPAGQGLREDAVVMRAALQSPGLLPAQLGGAEDSHDLV